jgi:hypothetical protein
MRSLDNTLALWVSGLLSSEEVVAWAGRQIARLDQPPMELFDLVCDGPERCLKRAQTDFAPRPSCLTYAQAFSVRAMSVNLASEESVQAFASWAARNCIGEEPSNPLAQLGYRLDHLLGDCSDPKGATALVRTELPSLLGYCKSLAAPYVETTLNSSPMKMPK